MSVLRKLNDVLHGAEGRALEKKNAVMRSQDYEVVDVMVPLRVGGIAPDVRISAGRLTG